jgi:hypothetical protein
VALRDRVTRLERDAGGGQVSIPQPDGTVKRFPASAVQDAFLINMRRLRGENVAVHPLAVAAAASPDPEWRQSAYSATVTIVTEPEDLSEP